MYIPVLVALAALVLLSLAMATPNRNDGCLLNIGHILALVAGSVAPFAIAWLPADKSGVPWWFWLLAVSSAVLGSCAMGLATFGWQMFFPGWVVARAKKRGRGRGTGTARKATKKASAPEPEPDLEKQVDLSVFDPSAFISNPTAGMSNANADPFGDCLFALLAGIVGGIFWLGLQLAQWIGKALLPKLPVSTVAEGTPPVASSARRITRGVLCFVFAFAIVALTTLVLSGVLGRSSAA